MRVPAASSKLPKRRWLTWRRAAVAFTVLALMAIAALAHVAAHLETPWLRQKVIAAVRAAEHVNIDYRQASVGPGGLELRDLTLASLPEDQDLAPELLHVERVSANWKWRDLLPGHERRLNVDVAGVALNLVVDTHGETSLSRLLAVLPPSPQRPLSQLLAGLNEAPPLRLEHLQVAGMRARVARRLAAGGVQRATLGDLTFNGHVATGKKPQVDVTLTGAPLRLELTDWPLALPDFAGGLLSWLAPLRTGTGVLPLALTSRLQLADDRLKVTANLRAGDQELLAVDVTLQPQARQRGLDVRLHQLALLGRLTGQMQWFVDDAMTALAGNLKLDADLPALKTAELDWQGGKLAVTGKGLHLALDPSQTTVEQLDVDLWTPGVALAGVRLVQARVMAGLQVQAGARLRGDASVQVKSARAHVPAGEVTVTEASEPGLANNALVSLSLNALPDAATLTVLAHLPEVDVASGERKLHFTSLSPNLQIETAGLAALLAEPLGALRSLALQLTVQGTRMVEGGQMVEVGETTLGVRLPPMAREGDRALRVPGVATVDLQTAFVRTPHGRELRSGMRLALVARNLRVVPDQPLDSTGELDVTAFGPLELHGHVQKRADEVSWQLDFSTIPQTLVDLLGVSAPVQKLVDWRRLQFKGNSAGTATHLAGTPLVEQASVLTLRELHLPKRADITDLVVSVQSAGEGLRQRAKFAADVGIVKLGPLRVNAPLRLEGKLDHDPQTRVLALQLVANGPQGLRAALDLNGHAHGADLAYAMHAQARNVAAFLRGLPLADRGALCLLDSRFAMRADVKGTLTGAARVFAQQPPAGMEGHHTLALALQAVSCKRPEGSVKLSKLDMTGEASWAKGAGQADVRVALPNVDASASGHALRLDGLEQHLAAELRVDGTIHLAGDGKLARLTQDALPGLPLRDMTWQVRGWSGAEGARLELLQVNNPPTGTRVTFTGGLDRAALRPPKVTDADVNGQALPAALPPTGTAETAEPVPGRLGLNLVGEVRQDLEALVHDNPDVKAHGVITVPIHLESGDLVVFHTEARVHFDHVAVSLPHLGLEVSEVLGDMPLVETFTLAPQFQLLGGGEDDAYSRWRFSEHQPFLRRSDFLSIGKIRYGGAEIGPIAGNANVDRDVFRMDQLEATLLHGQLTGQCMVLLSGEDTHVQLRGNATGLQVAGSDERFDANMALDFLPARRALDGRAEILHMGRKHLESLLNLWDPYGEDAQSNRLRTVLKFGHPERVRMRFQHGFMDVGVELGGLSGVVQIEELRGIALGPVFERWLDPLLDPLRALRVREAPKP